MIKTELFYLCSSINRGVAQLASVPRSGRGGRRFESFHPDFLKNDLSINALQRFKNHKIQ